MDNENLKRLYFFMMGALLFGTFAFVIVSGGNPTANAVKEDNVLYPDATYDVTSCIEDAEGHINAGLRNRETLEITHITLSRDAYRPYRCSGLSVIFDTD